MVESALLWQWLAEAVEAGQAAALLVVTASRGSSPGKAGAKMAVSLTQSYGSIGGGALESEMLARARQMLVSGQDSPQILRFVHRDSPGVPSSGMICGGEQSLLIYPCRKQDSALFAQLHQACRQNRPVVCLIGPSGLHLQAADAAEMGGAEDGDWFYRETVGLGKQAFIIGGGHVGLALSRILHGLDFNITVIDDRIEPATLQANHYARQKRCLPYAEIGAHVPEGKEVFAFIMTHDYRGDAAALQALAGKRLAYLGILGSRHKLACLRSLLAGELTERQWRDLHAPMGLAIGSHSPAEIAVSIAAEVIQVCRGIDEASDGQLPNGAAIPLLD